MSLERIAAPKDWAEMEASGLLVPKPELIYMVVPHEDTKKLRRVAKLFSSIYKMDILFVCQGCRKPVNTTQLPNLVCDCTVREMR
mgnify:CR=1 FL=1